jgi:hypothetical protein
MFTLFIVVTVRYHVTHAKQMGLQMDQIGRSLEIVAIGMQRLELSLIMDLHTY